MTYTKISLYLANGIPEALSNLWYGSDSAVVEIRDAVEDAKNGKDLLNRIQKMKLLRKFTLDRETEKRIRFKGTDCLVLVYKCRQKKLNSLYYKKKEQRRCSTWRKIKNRILRNSSSRSSISTMPEVPHILNWNMNMA